MHRFWILLILPLIIASDLKGHESRPVYLKLDTKNDLTSAEFKVPITVHADNLPILKMDSILINKNVQWTKRTTGYHQNWQLTTPGPTVKGSHIQIEFPKFNPVLSTIIAVTFGDGEEHILIIPPNENSIQIPYDMDADAVRGQYCQLGIKHIWEGVDHLLFVICLVVIAGFSKKLLITITGFTLAHSITLIMSALKLIRLPIPPIEAAIALSIVFLCYEIIHHHADKKSLTYRYPVIVASSFGLLHGLGFAAVLGEIGLPYKHSFDALLFFNVGVEVGQIVFIAVLFLIVWSVNILSVRFLALGRKKRFQTVALRTGIYLVGIMAAYWIFDRIL